MSEQKFKDAKGNLAFSQMLRDKLLMQKNADEQQKNPTQDPAISEDTGAEPTEVQQGEDTVDNEVEQLDQRVMDLSQRVDVLEAEEKQPEMD